MPGSRARLRTLPLLLAVLYGCTERTLPTTAPDAAAFSHDSASCVVTNGNDAGEGSLRSVLAHLPTCTTITFAPDVGTVVFNSSLWFGGRTIRGPAGGTVVIEHRSEDREPAMIISDVTLENLTIRLLGDGAIVVDQGFLHVVNCTITDAWIDPAIMVGWEDEDPVARLVLFRSTLRENTAGGIFVNEVSTAQVIESTFSTNTIDIENRGETHISGSTFSHPPGSLRASDTAILNTGVLSLINSTISGKQAANRINRGGAITNLGALEVSHSTITANRFQPSQFRPADIGAGGIYNTGPLTMTHTILAGNEHTFSANTGDGLPSFADFYDGSAAGSTRVTYSLIGSAVGNNLIHGEDGNMVGVGADALLLGPLADNGGPTPTHALLPGSPALDAGDPAFTPPPATDQRGAGFSRIRGGRIDIGAFERQGSGFDFRGFFPPITGPPALNPVIAGRNVRISFGLGGDFGSHIFADDHPQSQQIHCHTLQPTDPNAAPEAAEGNLFFDAATESYTYRWKTEKGWLYSCRQLTLRFSDDSVQTVNFVLLR